MGEVCYHTRWAALAAAPAAIDPVMVGATETVFRYQVRDRGTRPRSC